MPSEYSVKAFAIRLASNLDCLLTKQENGMAVDLVLPQGNHC